MALPVITRNKNDELQGAQEYYDTNKRCIFCDVVHHETKVNTARLIDENEHFISIAPYAPMYSYETWLLPKRHSSNFETTGDEEVNQLNYYLQTLVLFLITSMGLLVGSWSLIYDFPLLVMHPRR